MKKSKEIITALGLALGDLDAKEDKIYIECFNEQGKKIYTNIKTKVVKELIKTSPNLKTITKNINIDGKKFTIKMSANISGISIIDDHTSLYTKSFLNTNFHKIVPEKKVSTFVMCDVDFFKSINDSYGHVEGDKVLRKLSEILKNNIRETDYAIRFGGEEMLLIFPNTRSSDIREKVETIRKEIKNTYFSSILISTKSKNSNKLVDRIKKLSPSSKKSDNVVETYNVTMSFGIYEYNPSTFIEKSLLTRKDTIIERADRALYLSKKNGRNRITEYSNIVPEIEKRRNKSINK